MSTPTHAAVLAVALVLAPSVANDDARQAPRTDRAGSPSAPVDLTGAELLRSELALLREMGHMGETLNQALRNPAYIRDRRLMTALNDASRDFEQMAAAFQSMTRDLSPLTGGAPAPSDAKSVK